jgi:hypothetical protein
VPATPAKKKHKFFVGRTIAAFVRWDVGIRCSNSILEEGRKSSVLRQKVSTSAYSDFEGSSSENP